MVLTQPDAIASLMASFRNGDKEAVHQLVELLYPQLRRLALSRMQGERQGHTWQPTVLVSELYLELVRIDSLPPRKDGQNEKAAFFGLAAQIMRRLLIRHARPLSKQTIKVELDEAALANRGIEDMAEIESVLGALEAIRPRLRTVVEMKVFEGLTAEEIAAQLNCGVATVTRDWSFARHWLQRELVLPEK